MWGCYPYAMYPNAYNPYGYPVGVRQSNEIIDRAIYYSVLCYQVEDVLFDKDSRFYRGKMIYPVWPEELKRVTQFCGTSLGTTSQFGMIFETETTNVVCFRGTKLTVEWIQDAIAIPVAFTYVPGSGDVHKGFFDIYKSTRDQILDTVQRMDSNKQLVITGHSLGGALATLCTLDMAVNSKFKNPIIFTYGEPKVGKPDWIKTFNSTINTSVRVENVQDGVPELPPPAFGFEHVKGEVLLDLPGEILTDPTAKNNPHSIAWAYFRGLAQMSPQFATQLCTSNPPEFCPPGVPIGS